MAISLDSIYAPLNEFFLKMYQRGDNSPVLFRFDQYGFKISDEDYDPAVRNPNEVFSDLVNRLPVLADDGATVVFVDKPLDETYHQVLLKPALPCPPPGADAATRDALQNTFASLKNAAVQDYESTYSQARDSGIAALFRLSSPSPSNWYDRTNTEIWNSYATTVTDEPGRAPAAPATRKPLWTLRLNDQQLTQLLPPLDPVAAPKTPDFFGTENSSDTPDFFGSGRASMASLSRLKVARAAGLNINPAIMAALAKAPADPAVATPVAEAALPEPAVLKAAPRLATARVGPLLMRQSPLATRVALGQRFNFEPATGLLTPPAPSTPTPAPAERTPVQLKLRTAFKQLAILDKLSLTNFLKDASPTQDVATNAVKISFDYCLVRIARGWFSSIFLENPHWYLPGYHRGELSDGPGGLSALPTAMLLVKNLRISANWSGADLASVRAATGFGPFNVDAPAAASTDLGHEGIQIVGWLLQKLPSLPANDPPAPPTP